MSRTVIGYDADGHKVWSDSIPARARIPWTQAGSIAGVFAMPARAAQPMDRSESATRGWQTKRKLRGEGLAP